jgi:dTDP-4-dehydrorhamnose reductase
MKRVFLTGGKGFFGTRFREAHHHNFEILSTDVEELNIIDKEKVQDALNLFKPDYVIHAAAIALTDFCDQNPEKCYGINVTGTLNVAAACRRIGAKMVFLSSEQIFNGNEEPGPYRETDLPHPDTVYGANKWEAEKLLKDQIEEYWVLRFTWLFGVPERYRPVVSNIFWDTVKTALRGKKVKVPCNEYRGLTYIGEVMDQFTRVFDLPCGTYHVGSHNDLNRYEVVCLILRELGLEERIDELVEKDAEKYRDRARDARLNTEKIRKRGFHFSDTSEAIRKCIQEYNLRLS